jgi:cytochrome c-type biogenesis protein CcmF
VWLFTGVITDIIAKIKEAKIKLNKLSHFFKFISRINLGIHVAHIGVAVFLAGVTGEQFYKTEYNGRKNIGDFFDVGDKSLEFKKIEMLDGPNYTSQTATFNLLNDGKVVNVLRPEKRFYPTEKSQTTEAAILSSFLGDTYLVLGDGNKEIGWSIRVYFNPLVSWIWGGACLMALGGLVSILQNRKSRKILQ